MRRNSVSQNKAIYVKHGGHLLRPEKVAEQRDRIREKSNPQMKRVILVLAITVIGLLASFVDAFWGLLLYTWFSFASPLELTYGTLEGSRISLFIGVVLVATCWYQRGAIACRHRITALIALFVFAAFCSLAFQMRFDLPTIFRQLELLLKIAIVACLVPVLLDTVVRVHLYVLTIAVSGGLLGFYYGVFGLMAGSKQIFGPGRIGDNNGYAVFLSALLPVIFFVGRNVRLGALNWTRGALTAIALSGNVVAIILTYSRGGFLAGLLSLFLVLGNVRSGLARAISWGAVLPIIIFSVWTIFSIDTNVIEFPDEGTSGGLVEQTMREYVARLRTLRQEVSDEASAGGRIHFWQVALEMISENPIFGVGLKQFALEYNRYDFSDGAHGQNRAVHNTLLSVFSETGLFGGGVFLALIGSVLFCARSVGRRCKTIKDAQAADELRDYARMIVIALFAFILGGLFVNVLYQEIFWALLSIAIGLDRVSAGLQTEKTK